METNLLSITKELSKLSKNIHLKLSIEGWPAVVAITVICGTYLATTAIKERKSPKAADQPQQKQAQKPIATPAGL